MNLDLEVRPSLALKKYLKLGGMNEIPFLDSL